MKGGIGFGLPKHRKGYIENGYIKVNKLLQDKSSEEKYKENDIEIYIEILKEIRDILTKYKKTPEEERPEGVNDDDLKCDNEEETFFDNNNCLLSVDNYNYIVNKAKNNKNFIKDVLYDELVNDTSGGRKKRRTTKKRRTIKKKSRKNKLRKSKVNKKCK